eukprot:CAMPEP_0115741532 /NCGR_PEP_ID=MMETSP0272-20121206/90055_1 /TAXON_ID=71861 /ORGANISM="Scrippsiella trochoidea, Strain CCMP3099" /LENGTH=93 /DNA_ID=CAMNT_0003186215 /DNA_START=362 /DNA_END=640 /DNA_ORIENTATION=+
MSRSYTCKCSMLSQIEEDDALLYTGPGLKWSHLGLMWLFQSVRVRDASCLVPSALSHTTTANGSMRPKISTFRVKSAFTTWMMTLMSTMSAAI